MTKVKAREILGITPSAGVKTAEKAYRQKVKKLQLRLVPGNPCSMRQQAKQELADLTEAWHLLKPMQSKGKPKPAPRKTAETDQLPQNLVEAWDWLMRRLSFSNPFVISLIIVVLLIVLTFSIEL